MLLLLSPVLVTLIGRRLVDFHRKWPPRVVVLMAAAIPTFVAVVATQGLALFLSPLIAGRLHLRGGEAPMTFAATVLTLYPEMFPGPLGVSLAGRALREERWSLDAVQIREFATDKHRSVDDTPAGGGAGMVLRADVVAAALDSVEGQGRPVLAMTPRGAPLTQARVRELAAGPGVTLLCGRFEGFDQRLFEARAIEEVSIGDYVLSGGEMAALVLLDACIRLLPGVMGAPTSGVEESFESGLLEYPHYTRPYEWEGRTIPEVLRSGDHAKIAAWRLRQAEIDTRLRRPDLWERHEGARVRSPSGARREKD
jgi:tRNA (guanine37-N1)-methyltransferase